MIQEKKPMPCQSLSINTSFRLAAHRVANTESPVMMEKWPQWSRLLFCAASAAFSWFVAVRFFDLALGI